MRNIKVMSENMANKIAAGEIVLRPVSVVKEIVENSLDANATIIEINLLEGGINNIEIIDNGDGMDEQNLRLCIKRHATSKVYNDEELFKIASLGFRGEALASILAVSKLSIVSSPDGINAYKLSKVNENDIDISKVGANKGTTVNVANLFYNTPARYSGLSNPNYELSLIVKYVQSVSLIYPNVSFKLTNENNTIYESYGNDNIFDVFNNIYDLNISQNILTVKDATNNFEIEIFFSNAQVSKPRKNHIYISINNRIVRNLTIEKNIIESYKNYLHTNQYPIVLLKVNASYSLLDVNIHPTKQEIQISLIDELVDMINFNIKKVLRDTTYINSFKNDEVHVINEQSDDTYDVYSPKTEQTHLNFEQKKVNFVANEEIKSESLTTESIKVDEKYNLELLSYIGNYLDTYLIFQNKSGLFLVDQHAAQERINYEIIRNKFINREFTMQSLLTNNLINLTTDEFINIENNLSKFEVLGLHLEVFGPNTLKITSADKFYFKFNNLNDDIYNLILKSFNNDLEFIDNFDSLAILMSCKSSIKAHQNLIKIDADLLISQLKQCDDKYTCPHGRPIIVSFSNYEIEKLFKRVF